MDHVATTRRETVEELGLLCERCTTRAYHAAKRGDYAGAARDYGIAETAANLAFHTAALAALDARRTGGRS